MPSRARVSLLVLLRWLLLWPLLACGCARVPAGALAPLEPGQLEARVALAEAVPPQGDAVEHALALAEAEHALARLDRAAAAAHTALRRAEMAWWMARLRGDAEATKQARRRLDRTAAAARQWAERTDDPRLMVLAVLASPHPRRHRAALRRAVAVLPRPPRDVDPQAVAELVGDDPAARRQLARWLDEEERVRVGIGRAYDGDPEALDLLREALAQAVERRRPTSELRERAGAVLAADPWAVEARLLVLGLDELAAGVLADDPLLLDDLSHDRPSHWREEGPLARLHLRARATPRSRALPLALAWLLLQAELVGDAHGVLERLAIPAAEAAAQRLHAQLRVMTAARRGDVAALEHWRIATEVRSPALDVWLAELDHDATSPTLRAAAARARRRLARLALPLADGGVDWALLLDPRSDAEGRDRVLHGLEGLHGEAAAWGAICSETHRDAAACQRLWWHEDPSVGLVLAGRTRHFHPDFLDGIPDFDGNQLRAVVAPLVATYADTVLAASPELEGTRLRLLLAAGDHAGARARLTSHGALLPNAERAWAWLVLGDLESGAAVFDDARRWLPVFSHAVPAEPEGEPEPPAPLRVDRYLQGMAAAASGRHAEALERLGSALDGMPDAAMSDGLAQAALAAHLAGDAAQRDAWSARLYAVDPHGPAYALVQARIATDAGRPARALEHVGHALAWHPDDVVLHRLVLTLLGQAAAPPADALALAFASEAAPADEYLYRPVRRQIRRGQLSTLAQLQRALAAMDGTPADAWEADPALREQSPWLTDRAVEHGVTQVSEAEDLATAHAWAADTLELFAANGPRTSWAQQQQVWLCLLLGRTDEGLAAARRIDREHDLAPLSEGDAVVLLLRARAAGELDDAGAWDLWRWVHDADDEAEARVQALLLDPPSGSIVQVFACGELVAAEELGPAHAVCNAAWRVQPHSLALAVSQSFLGLLPPASATEEGEDEPGDPAPKGSSSVEGGRALVDAVFRSAVKAPAFDEQPALALGGNLAEAWHHNHALWLGSRGEHEAAAEAWWQAYALGDVGEGGLDHGYDHARFRGPLVRALVGMSDERDLRDLDLERSVLALAGADPAVAAAYAQLARARVVKDPAQLDRTRLMRPDRLVHLSAWAAGDLAAGRLDAAAMGEVVPVAVALAPELPAAQALHARYPEASLVRLALLQAHHAQGDEAAARDEAEALLERHPDDPLAVAAALPLLVQAGEDARARALYEAAAARHPGDALLVHADAPESITGPRDGVPAWVREPARFDERLALVSDAAVQGLAPRRHVSVEKAAEAFVPIGWAAEDAQKLRFTDESGARIVVLSSPRASRCQGAACATDLLQGVAGQGRTQQWIRQVTMAGSEATQAVFTNAEEVLVAWVLPSGGRVLTVVVAAPNDRFDALRPVLVMLRDGVRPLDAVLPLFPAESLRAAGRVLRDGWRLRGRRELARATEAACPVSETLAALPHDHQRAELLVDLWLATPQASVRQALLRCTSPRAATARRLALVALLDEHPDVHAFGRRAVQAHATRVADDVRTILTSPLSPPVSAPDYLVRSDLPAHGVVEVLGALPLTHAQPLVDRLLVSRDPRDRMLAWAAVRLRPALATDAAIGAALAGEPRLATEAAFLLSDRGTPADAQRLREHLDGLPAAATREAQDALTDVAFALATFLDPQDEARLRDAATKLEDGDDPTRAAAWRERLREIARDHARGIALADPALARGPDDGRALRWRDEQRHRTLPFRPASELRTRSLAQVLPGSDWTFARLAAPGLFSSTVADVAERLTTGDEAVDQRLGELTSGMLREGGFAALSQSGGLDVTKPIECAKPADDQGWLCTAHVSDRAALLAVLGQRDYGDDAGVSLPLTVATTAGIVPVALSLLPAILHPLLYPEDDEDDDDAPDAEEAAERSRMALEVGGMQLELYSIVQARTRRLGIDSERYLFLGDRLWVFSTDAAMDQAMRAHDGPVLADDPEFRRLTAAWQDGAALQAVALGRAWPLAEGGAAMEVVLDEGGLRFRYAGAFESEEGVTDIGPAVAQLPAGAVTVFAHGLGSAESFAREPLVAKGPDAPRVPPLPLLTKARGVAFGWYLQDGDRLWRRWLAVAPLDDALRKALRRAKTPPGRPGASRRHGALCYVERPLASGTYLLVGDCTLVDEAAAGPPPPAASREQLRVAHAVFDGPAAAARLPELDGVDLEQRAILRAAAPLLGVVTDMRVQAHWIPAERIAVLEGEVGLRLRPPGDRTRVIDDWLAASEGHNAATLPRRLRSEELEAPLRYVLEVPDADAFVRHTLVGSPRVTAEVLGPTRVRMTVAPVPAKPVPAPLDADRREELTKTSDALRSDDPRIVELARRLAPPGTKPALAAEQVSRWVHERITYEVTPRSLDGVEILAAGRGDCTEYARLTVALLRAANVPAEVRDGMAASGDELVAHAWVAYHDGESWHEIDPTWGRTTASAGHLEMSVLDAIALVSLGKLKIVEITAGAESPVAPKQ